MSVQERALKATAAGAFTAFSGVLATRAVSSTSFFPFFVYLVENPLKAGAAGFAVSYVAETVCNAVEKRWLTLNEETLFSLCLKFSLRTVVYLAVGSAAGMLIPSIGLTSGSVIGITALLGALLLRICKVAAMFLYSAVRPKPSEFSLALRAYSKMVYKQADESIGIQEALNQCIKFIKVEGEISFRDKMYRIKHPSPNEDVFLDHQKSSVKRGSFLEPCLELLSAFNNYPILPGNLDKVSEIREVHRRRVEHHQKIVSSLEKLLEDCAISVTTAEKSTKTVNLNLNNN